MTDDRLIEVLNKLSSALEEGMIQTRSCVGLTFEDSQQIRFLRDKVSYALGTIDFYLESLESYVSSKGWY